MRGVLLKLPGIEKGVPAGFEITWHKDGDVFIVDLNPGDILRPVILAAKRDDLADYLYTLAQLVRGWGGKEREELPSPPPVVVEDIGPEPPARPINPGIILEDLNGNSAHDWPLIAQRFPWLADTIEARYLKVKPQVDEVGQAVAKLLPHRAELLDSEGKPKHGAKTQVAKIMQFSQTGGGFARRIDTLLAALAEVA